MGKYACSGTTEMPSTIENDDIPPSHPAVPDV